MSQSLKHGVASIYHTHEPTWLGRLSRVSFSQLAYLGATMGVPPYMAIALSRAPAGAGGAGC